jgi:hypothetical protein
MRRSSDAMSRPGNCRNTRGMERLDGSPAYRAGIGISFTTAPIR